MLRALPAGEPSSKLDSAILAAAADAVAGRDSSTAPRPRRRVARVAWALPSWAIGTAAAAVLAIGIGTQLVPRPATTAEDAVRPSAPPSARIEAQDRLDVELIERKREIPPTAPAPQPFPSAPLADAPAAAAAAPTDDARRRGDNVERLRSSPSEINRLDTARRLEARQVEEQREREAVAQARVLGETARAEQADADAFAEADAAAGAAKPTAATAPRALPPVAGDASLPPAEWIARVRERWRAGDREGARASLRLLREAHPDLAIPADLAPLLR